MAVRPFYTESRIDGRQTLLSGGPRSKDGTMRTVIYQRDNGAITKAFSICCGRETVDGVEKLVTSVYDSNGDLVAEHYTDY